MMGATANSRRWAHLIEPSGFLVGSIGPFSLAHAVHAGPSKRKPNPGKLALVSSVPNGANSLLLPGAIP